MGINYLFEGAVIEASYHCRNRHEREGSEVEAEAGRNRENKKKPESVNVNVDYCKMDHRRWVQRWRQRQEVIENIRNLNLSMLMLIIAKWIIGDGYKGRGRGRKK